MRESDSQNSPLMTHKGKETPRLHLTADMGLQNRTLFKYTIKDEGMNRHTWKSINK